MIPQRAAWSLAASVLVLLASGCFDYNEQVSFDDHGAGKLQIQFELGDLSTAEKIVASIIKKNPINENDLKKGLPTGVRITEYKEEVKNEQKTIYLTAVFEDLNKLKEWKVGDDYLFKNIQLNRVDDTWVFERLLKAKDDEQLKNAKKHLSRSKLIFKLSGPGKLVTDKSNPQRTENDGNTCVWEGSFPDLLEGKDGAGTVFRAQYFVGTPMWMKLAIGGGILLVILVAGGLVLGGVLLGKKKTASA